MLIRLCSFRKRIKENQIICLPQFTAGLVGAHRWGDQTNMPELPKLPIPTTCWDIKEKFDILRNVTSIKSQSF